MHAIEIHPTPATARLAPERLSNPLRTRWTPSPRLYHRRCAQLWSFFFSPPLFSEKSITGNTRKPRWETPFSDDTIDHAGSSSLGCAWLGRSMVWQVNRYTGNVWAIPKCRRTRLAATLVRAKPNSARASNNTVAGLEMYLLRNLVHHCALVKRQFARAHEILAAHAGTSTQSTVTAGQLPGNPVTVQVLATSNAVRVAKRTPVSNG